MIARNGYGIIITAFVIVLALVVLYVVVPVMILGILTLFMAVLAIFNLFFFRDPERNIPSGKNLILSPADGTVIKIDEIEEHEYFKTRVQRLSIFLSVFNVHINRIPVSGTIDFYRYKKGKFVAAFDHKASEENEQSIIGIDSHGKHILFALIAGVIARRIITTVKAGDQVIAGERCGLIRYGSRVDMYFPPNVNIRVRLKDKVKGGETIIGEFN